MCTYPRTQVVRFQQTLMQRRVQSGNRFHQWETPAEVGERAYHRGCPIAAPHHRLAYADIGTPHDDSRQPRGGAARWKGHLDRVARWKIETVKPARGTTGEDCRHGKTPAVGRKHHVGVGGNRAQCVKAATESPPARAEEVIFSEPMPSGLLKVEGTRGERYGNCLSSRHGPESWARRLLNGTQPKKDSECWEKRESNALESRSAAHSMTKKRGSSSAAPRLSSTNYIFERDMPPPIPLGIFIVPLI